jgi:hypothetical protein
VRELFDRCCCSFEIRDVQRRQDELLDVTGVFRDSAVVLRAPEQRHG